MDNGVPAVICLKEERKRYDRVKGIRRRLTAATDGITSMSSMFAGYRASIDGMLSEMSDDMYVLEQLVTVQREHSDASHSMNAAIARLLAVLDSIPERIVPAVTHIACGHAPCIERHNRIKNNANECE